MDIFIKKFLIIKYKNMSQIYEEMSQYDYSSDDYIDELKNPYSKLIGSFLIEYSRLEHELNISIADLVFDDCHDLGYHIIEKMRMSNKIYFYYKYSLRVEVVMGEQNKKFLKKIYNNLRSLNKFRNIIAHADWCTLDKQMNVRTSIITDDESGIVKFKKVKVTLKNIEQNIKLIGKVLVDLDKYYEKRCF